MQNFSANFLMFLDITKSVFKSTMDGYGKSGSIQGSLYI